VQERVAYPLRNRIIPAWPERIAPSQAAECQPSSAKCTVTVECFDGIGGTTWIITARGRQQRRQHDLIRPHEQDEHGPRHCSDDVDDRTARRLIHRGNRRGNCVAARTISIASSSNDAVYASGRARMTMSTESIVAKRRVRTSSRKRRFSRLRSIADLEYRGTTIPTRGCPKAEAITRTSRCIVRIRFPSRATFWSSTPRVSRWLRGKSSPCRGCWSGAAVLARDPNSQPLPPFLPTAAESLASPLGRHAGTKPVRTGTPLIAGTIGGLTHELGDSRTREGATTARWRRRDIGG
jgi:hypothetical protein